MWAIIAVLVILVLCIVYYECTKVHFVLPTAQSSHFTSDRRSQREVQADDAQLTALCTNTMAGSQSIADRSKTLPTTFNAYTETAVEMTDRAIKNNQPYAHVKAAHAHNEAIQAHIDAAQDCANAAVNTAFNTEYLPNLTDWLLLHLQIADEHRNIRNIHGEIAGITLRILPQLVIPVETPYKLAEGKLPFNTDQSIKDFIAADKKLVALQHHEASFQTDSLTMAEYHKRRSHE